jgi:hypothetical protein
MRSQPKGSRSDPLKTAMRVNIGSYRFLRLGAAVSNVLKIRWPSGRVRSTPTLGTIEFNSDGQSRFEIEILRLRLLPLRSSV